jgi:hypothetical protein
MTKATNLLLSLCINTEVVFGILALSESSLSSIEETNKPDIPELIRTKIELLLVTHQLQLV